MTAVMNTNTNLCIGCGLRGGCACLWQSATLCKKCAGKATHEQTMEINAALDTRAKTRLDFYHSSCGIGDAVCALYAACGAADAGADAGLAVTFHTHQAHWLARFAHPGVSVVDDGARPATDIHRDYGEQLSRATCRKSWFGNIMAEDAAVAPFAPAPPRTVNRETAARRVDFTGDYVVFSPYASWSSRSWPISHWARLAELVVRSGKRVVMIDAACTGESPRLPRDFGSLSDQVSCAWGHGPDYVTDLLLGAKAFVGNDSGMTHLAGALRVPTVAVHAALPPQMLWSLTDILAVTPQTDCAFCRWQGARGWSASCDSFGCTALSSIAPDRVLEAICLVSEGEN